MEKPEIIHEDDYLIVFGKPSGWITNSASTTTNQPVLQDWISENLDFEISKSREFRSGIVHRLDKETSGCLVVAKKKSVFRNLQKQFKERLVKKTYMALSHGKIFPESGQIKASVGRLSWRRDRFGVVPGGREAETDYQVKTYYKNKDEDFSLVLLFPKTGRTHQIRIHLKYLGNPIVSDEFYAGRKTYNKDKVWCERLFLHAKEISFLHPDSGKEVEYKSPLPEDLKSALSTLSKD